MHDLDFGSCGKKLCNTKLKRLRFEIRNFKTIPKLATTSKKKHEAILAKGIHCKSTLIRTNYFNLSLKFD